MLKIPGIVAVCLLVAIAAVLIYATTRPDTFRVARSVVIRAPADKIFLLINDYHHWIAWSPYETKDPAMKRTFGVAATGKGATYAWEGNGQVGSGNMLTSESTPPSKVAIKLNMVKPIATSNDVTFTLVPEGADTTVTWEMRGAVPYFAKIIHLFFDMDRMVGGDFQSGLNKLKAAAEK